MTDVPAPFLRLREDGLRLLAQRSTEEVDGLSSTELEQQERERTTMLDLLTGEPGGCWRDGPRAHLTASVMLLDHTSEHVLLTLHRKARLWLQLGGHLEAGDDSIRDAALREATEESGIPGIRLSRDPVQLHTHELAAAFGHCTRHHDVRFAGWAPPGAQPVVSDESDDVRWWPVDALPEQTDPDLPELVAAARAAGPA